MQEQRLNTGHNLNARARRILCLQVYRRSIDHVYHEPEEERYSVNGCDHVRSGGQNRDQRDYYELRGVAILRVKTDGNCKAQVATLTIAKLVLDCMCDNRVF